MQVFQAHITAEPLADSDFEDWLADAYKSKPARQSFLEKNYIPDVDLAFGNFREFFDERRTTGGRERGARRARRRTPSALLFAEHPVGLFADRTRQRRPRGRPEGLHCYR